MIELIKEHSTIFFMIYLVSSVIGYFAVDNALNSDRLKNRIPAHLTTKQLKKVKLMIKIILLVFVHIPVINTVYALFFIFFFIKGFFFNK